MPSQTVIFISNNHKLSYVAQDYDILNHICRSKVPIILPNGKICLLVELHLWLPPGLPHQNLIGEGLPNMWGSWFSGQMAGSYFCRTQERPAYTRVLNLCTSVRPSVCPSVCSFVHLSVSTMSKRLLHGHDFLDPKYFYKVWTSYKIPNRGALWGGGEHFFWGEGYDWFTILKPLTSNITLFFHLFSLKHVLQKIMFSPIKKTKFYNNKKNMFSQKRTCFNQKAGFP